MEVIKKAYLQGEVEIQDTKEEEENEEEDHDAASPRNVGHNIYILAHQVFSPFLVHVSCQVYEHGQRVLMRVCSCTVGTSQQGAGDDVKARCGQRGGRRGPGVLRQAHRSD